MVSPGEAWDYFPPDQARSRAYRWGEDGIAGICDNHQRLCFAIAAMLSTASALNATLYGTSRLSFIAGNRLVKTSLKLTFKRLNVLNRLKCPSLLLERNIIARGDRHGYDHRHWHDLWHSGLIGSPETRPTELMLATVPKRHRQ
ncbi:hypothetical protein C7271_14655 [filamentous cyanobacterium CCP5]|nr:hypothetical protein C7271_14655 [filamentous cyanobacterium CCP5]